MQKIMNIFQKGLEFGVDKMRNRNDFRYKEYKPYKVHKFKLNNYDHKEKKGRKGR